MSDDAPITGGCRCGAVRYRVAIATLPPCYACHCHQCQRWSGSAFSQQALVPEAALDVTGPIVEYRRTAEDSTSHHRICGECHARIHNTSTRRPGMAVLRAGTLDRAEELRCVLHIFTASKQAWLVLPDEVPQWPGWAPPEALVAALAAAS